MPSNNKITHLNDDLQFLINCCKTNPREDDIEFIHTYLNTKRLTPNALISLANQHGVLPLVYKTLKKLSEEDLLRDSLNVNRKSNNEQPNTTSYHESTMPRQEMPLGCTSHEILSAFKQQYLSIAQRNMLMTSELIKIMHLLKENHIEALAFKGPALAQMAYGDITLRQYVDLDVLTKKEDVYKIDTLLKSQSYERLLALTPVQEKIWIKYAHDMGLIHPTKGVHFEMHWSFLDEDYPMQVNLKDFWKETQEVNLNGYPIYTFSNENLLVYLCIHGSKHLWERIEWIKDIDLLIQNNEIDWGKVIEKSKGTGFEKMIYLGLLLSASLFKTRLPKMIQEKIVEHQQLNTISNFILKSWQTQKNTFAKTAVMLKLFPSIKEQVLYLHKIILKPSFNEYWYINLPKGFYWFYYFLRPYLLIKKYFTKPNAHDS